ncbi:hypothetical protein CRYUN_Cryun05aG0006200 [Craigia yunnanensis]
MLERRGREMEEFRPSYREIARRDGRKLEIIDTNMLKYGTKKRNKSSMSIKSWWNEPNMERKRRLAKYKMSALEGKVKDSLKKGHRWIRKKYGKIVHGY